MGPYPEGLLHAPWGPPVLRTGAPGRQYDLNLATTPEQAVAFIQRHRPAYIGGLVTRVAVVAHEALRQGAGIVAEAVLPFGEAVLPHHRELFGAAFGGAGRCTSSHLAGRRGTCWTGNGTWGHIHGGRCH